MSVDLVRADELSSSDLRAWAAVLADLPELASPFYRPEFTQDVASVRENVRVVVMDVGGERAFLPVSIDHHGVARGPAGHLSDFEGVIARAELPFCPDDVICEAGLSAWRFQHLLARDSRCEHVMWVRHESPTIELAAGYEAYRRDRLESRGRLIKELERKRRKAIRELRSVEFTFDDRDPGALEWLVKHKAAQLNQRGQWNYFEVPWTTPLFAKTLTHHDERYRGLVSTLRYDGRIVAAFMGLRSLDRLHAWTHVFDPAESKYSPGMVMLLELIRHAADEGISTIDLGRGDERYKSRFANGSVIVAEGGVERSSLASVARRTWFSAREFVRQTPAGVPAQAIIRKVRTWKRSHHARRES